MNDKKPNLKRKIEDEATASTSSAVQKSPIEVNDSANDQPPSPMLKLHIDCFEVLFEWLSIADLLALRQTCKRLKKVVDYFIESNYPGIGNGYERVVSIDDFNVNQNDTLKGILAEIESVHIRSRELQIDIYESILKYCRSLSYLRIHKITSTLVGGNEWLHQTYPTIEHIELDDSSQHKDLDDFYYYLGGEFVELKQFFETNPNIKILSTTMHFLEKNRNCWLKSNIKLDQLNLKGTCYFEDGMDDICGFLNELYDQGFYKRLHFYPHGVGFVGIYDEITPMLSLKGMEKLIIYDLNDDITKIDLPPMPELQEIGFRRNGGFDAFKESLKNLTKIERIIIESTTPENILYLMGNLATVKEIKIEYLVQEIHLRDNIIDVCALNNARNQLPGARKTTIYVPESTFLATKWATTETNYKLVELKRSQEIEWEIEF